MPSAAARLAEPPPSASPSSATLRHLTLEFCPRGVSERDGRQRLVFIPRPSVRAVSLAHGPLSERPLRQLLLGVALAATGGLGVLGLVLIALRATSPHPVRAVAEALAVCPFLLPYGLAVAATALRRGPYLAVSTDGGDRRKLRLPRTLDPGELDAFLARARDELGYPVTVEAVIGPAIRSISVESTR